MYERAVFKMQHYFLRFAVDKLVARFNIQKSMSLPSLHLTFAATDKRDVRYKKK